MGKKRGRRERGREGGHEGKEEKGKREGGTGEGRKGRNEKEEKRRDEGEERKRKEKGGRKGGGHKANLFGSSISRGTEYFGGFLKTGSRVFMMMNNGGEKRVWPHENLTSREDLARSHA